MIIKKSNKKQNLCVSSLRRGKAGFVITNLNVNVNTLIQIDKIKMVY